MASSVHSDSVVQSTWRSRLGGLIGTGALALVLFLTLLPVSAQVVIRESVDLSEPSATAEAPESFSDSTASFVAQRDGFLSVFYGTILRRDSEYPPGQPTLEVYKDGVLVVIDDVFSHSWHLQQQQVFVCKDGVEYVRFHYKADERIDLQIPVLTGETISFLFQTDTGTYGDDPDEGHTFYFQDSGIWSFNIRGYQEPCPTAEIEYFVFAAKLFPGPEFIRQDNTPIPKTGDDATLMVSKAVTDVNLPTSATFDGPPGSPVDMHTFRLQSGIINEAGPTVTFRIQHIRGGATLNTYIYGSESGTIGAATADVYYRMDKHVRLVSNERPSSGASGDYDEDVNDPSPNPAPNPTDDQTIRVEPGDIIRGKVFVNGVLEDRLQLRVGRPNNENGPYAVRRANLRFSTIDTETSDPTALTARASEDWAQMAIKFDSSEPHPAFQQKNNGLVFFSSNGGVIAQDGRMRVMVTAAGAGGPSGIARVRYTAGQSTRTVAARLAARILNVVGLPSAAHDFHDVLSLVVADWPEDVMYDVLENTDPTLVMSQPVVMWGTPYTVYAQELTGHNFGDLDPSTIEVFVVSPGSIPLGPSGQQLRAFAIPEEIESSGFVRPGSLNSIFLGSTWATDDDSIGPYVLGHEIGHILLDGAFTATDVTADSSGHVTSSLMNLMATPTTEPEDVQGTRRMTEGMNVVVRNESSSTPAILH